MDIEKLAAKILNEAEKTKALRRINELASQLLDVNAEIEVCNEKIRLEKDNYIKMQLREELAKVRKKKLQLTNERKGIEKNLGLR